VIAADTSAAEGVVGSVAAVVAGGEARGSVDEGAGAAGEVTGWEGVVVGLSEPAGGLGEAAGSAVVDGARVRSR